MQSTPPENKTPTVEVEGTAALVVLVDVGVATGRATLATRAHTEASSTRCNSNAALAVSHPILVKVVASLLLKECNGCNVSIHG